MCYYFNKCSHFYEKILFQLNQKHSQIAIFIRKQDNNQYHLLFQKSSNSAKLAAAFQNITLMSY